MGPFATGEQNHCGVAGRAVSALWHPGARKTLFKDDRLTVTLVFIIANALILKHVLTEEQIPQAMTAAMLVASLGPIMFPVVLNVLLIGDQFMGPSELLIIVAPIILPTAIELELDPNHFGIIMA